MPRETPEELARLLITEIRDALDRGVDHEGDTGSTGSGWEDHL